MPHAFRLPDLGEGLTEAEITLRPFLDARRDLGDAEGRNLVTVPPSCEPTA